MSALDTLRTALFGNPMQANFKPNREGVLAAFAELVQLVTSGGVASEIYDTPEIGIEQTMTGQLFLVKGSGNSFADLYKNVSETAILQSGFSIPNVGFVQGAYDRLDVHDEKFLHTYNNMTLAQLTAISSYPNGFTVYVTDVPGQGLLKRVTTGNRDPNGVLNTGADYWFDYGTPDQFSNELNEKYAKAYNNMTLAELSTVVDLPNGFTVFVTDVNPPSLLKRVTTGNMDPNGVVNTGADKWFDYSLPNGITPSVARTNTIVVMGNSRNTLYIPEAGRMVQKSHPITVALARMDQRGKIIANFATSNTTTDQFMSSLDDALALKPGIILVNGAYNDIALNVGGVGGTTAANNLIAAGRKAVAAGVIFAVQSEVGSTNLDSTRQNQATVFNNRIIEESLRTVGFDFIDTRPYMCGNDNVLLEQYTYDAAHVHYNGYGDVRESEPIRLYLTEALPYRPGYVLDEFGQPECGGYDNIAPNPLFERATGGTASAGVTGSFADATYFYKADSATLSATSSVGKVLLNGGFVAQGDSFGIEQTAALSSWISGHVVCGMVLLKTDQPINCAGVQIAMIAKGDNVETPWEALSVRQTFTWRGTDRSYRYLILTDEKTIPTYTTKQSLKVRVSAHAFGAGGVGIDIRQVGILRKQG